MGLYNVEWIPHVCLCGFMESYPTTDVLSNYAPPLFYPLGICQVWGSEVLAMSVGIVFMLDVFMCAKVSSNPVIWPHSPDDPIAHEYLLASLSYCGPFFKTILINKAICYLLLSILYR